MNSLFDFLIEILRIESLTGKEDRLSDLFAEKLRARAGEMPLTVERIGRALIVSGPHNPARPTLALAGHLDTVPGVETGDRVRDENDRIIGLGASDMKAGLAVMYSLLTPEIVRGSRYNLIQVYYDAEEGAYAANGIHRVLPALDGRKVDFCIVLEPTDNTLHLGCLGLVSARIRFIGRKAHSARPWQGNNAIYKAIPFLQRISKEEPRPVVSGGLEFREVISVTIAAAGTARNVVPGECDLTVNARLAPGTSTEQGRRWIAQLVAGEAEIEFLDEAPSCPVPAGNPLFESLRVVSGLPEHPKQAYTDVAAFHLHGIDAVNFGPGLTAQAHQQGEYVLKADLVKNYEILKSFLRGS